MTHYLKEIFGDYQLKKYLGGGGFADVYLGEHIYLSTKEHPIEAAVKILKGPFTAKEIAELRNEAQIILRLEHPQIVRIITFSVAKIKGQEIPFLVMPYASYGSLDKRHPRGTRVPLQAIVSYVKQIAKALRYAHDYRVVHRDIKPANFLLGGNEEVLLSDFGIAVLAHRTRSWVEQNIAGTAAYMAPEQFHAKAAPASDQYSLGIVTYEWLCGTPPFIGDFLQLSYQHNFVPPPPLHEKIPSISPEVENVVMRALAKDPRQRWPSVEAFALALEQASQPKPSIGTPLLTYRDYSRGACTVAWSPDSRQIASGARDGTIHIWDAMTGTVRLTYRGHYLRSVILAVWSPDGTRIASIAGDNIMQIWDAITGATLLTYRDGSNSGVLAWSPDGRYMASGVGSNVRIWDATTGNSVLTYHHSQYKLITAVTWSYDGKYIASADSNGIVHVWETASGVGIATYSNRQDLTSYSSDRDCIEDAGWSPNSQLVASCTGDGIIQIWDAMTGTVHLTYRGHSSGHSKSGRFAYTTTWSPDGTRIASAGPKSVQIWDATTGATYLTYHGHSEGVIAVKWSPDAAHIVSTDDQDIQVWNATTGTLLFTYCGHTAHVNAVTWSPDGTRIASAGPKNVQIWDATTGATCLTYASQTYSGKAMAWSPDGIYIASVSYDKTLQVWNTSTGRCILTCHGRFISSDAVAWSPDGRHIAITTGDIEVWNIKTKKRVVTYAYYCGARAVAWSPDGTLIAFGCDDETLQICKVDLTQDIISFPNPYPGSIIADAAYNWQISWSPDGSLIAWQCSRQPICIEEVITQKKRLTLPSATSVMKWSPDNTHIAIGNNSDVQIWNTLTGSIIYTYHNQIGYVCALAWSPDGTRIASAGYGVQVWQAI